MRDPAVIQKDLLRCIDSEFFYYLDVESLVTYPNNKKADFLNNEPLLTCMVHIILKNFDFQSCMTNLKRKMIHRYMRIKMKLKMKKLL